ncbi:MAG: DUF3592 domain-containing protein, partial [Actinobacteria bacterium]|nr:DUF3592 domain-containing protein [Actinomycetota bacterium]
DHRRTSRAAVRVPGVVLELRAVSSPSSHGTQYAPVLEFRTLQGRVVQAESLATSNPPVAQPGESVRVAYDPGEPTTAYVDTVAGSGILVYVLGLVLASLVLVVSATVLVSSLT